MQPKLAVFAYNFPHKKTQDFLLRLFLEGYKTDLVLACDPVKLNIPPSTVRTKIRHEALVHPKVAAERLGIPYYVVAHDSPEAVELLRRSQCDLGIVAGARILKRPVIDCFKIGIINFHPGLIPESRGLDAMLWSIYRDIPLGVTAHLIDERVDAGTILIKKRIPIHTDDTVWDLSERLYETQLDLLAPAIRAALEIANGTVQAESVGKSSYNRKMPADLERATLEKLPDYIRRFAAQPTEGCA